MAVDDNGVEVLKKAGFDLGAGNYAVQVVPASSIVPVGWTSFVKETPSDTVEVYKYYRDVSIIRTITITFSNPEHTAVTSVVLS